MRDVKGLSRHGEHNLCLLMWGMIAATGHHKGTLRLNVCAPMIYFVGGASRAGKTYLAKRLMAGLGIPLLELDYLKMGLAHGLPEYGVHPLDIWIPFEKTYAGADRDDIWEALLEAGRLARRIGVEIADTLGYNYPLADDQRVSAYLTRVRSLPDKAASFD